MKRLTVGFGAMLLISLYSQSVSAQHTAASLPASRSPEIVVKDFYTWYIHDATHNHVQSPWMTPAGRAAMSRYVTQRFIREIVRNEKLPEGEGFDADYFLQTQDPLPSSPRDEPRWLKSMTLSKVTVNGSTATAIVTFLQGYPKVKVSLVIEENSWKINRVSDGR